MASGSLTDSLRETLALFDGSREPLTTPEVAELLDLGRRSTYDRLERLVEHGRLETKKVGANARVWWRPRTNATGAAPDWSAAVESLIDDVLDDVEAGIFVLDENFDVAWINAATERYFGLDRERVVGRDKHRLVEECIAPVVEDPASFVDTVLVTYDDNTDTEHFECRVTPGDGRAERWLEHRSKSIDSGAFAGGRVELYYDVTERKRSEHERELAQYETLFEESKDVNVIVESDGTFQYVTPSARNVFGYEPEELVGEVGFEYIHPDDREEPRAEFAKMIETPGYEPTVEFRFKHSDGSWIVIEALARDLRDDPDIEGIVIYTRDVTERKAREEELKRYAGIIDAVSEPAYELDVQGRFTFVNEPFVEKSGYDEDELLGQHVSIGMDEEAIARAESQIADLFADGTDGNTTLEYEVVTKDGERIPVENRISLLTDEDGRVCGSAGVLWDMTERKERERKLAESEHRYRTLVENFPNGAVMLFNEDLRSLTVGGRVFEGMEASTEDLEGDAIPKHVPAELLDAIEPRYRAVFDGEASEFELEFDGEIRHFWVIPVYDDAGTVFAGIAMSQDVTQQKERERELERQREQLAALNNLNEVVRDITDAVINQSTREEIEAIVCDRLANADSYEFAWIGEVDPQMQSITPRVEAGVDGYLKEIPLSTDPDDPAGRGPAGRAVRTREIQITQDTLADPDFEPWCEHAKKYGYRSAAAIPIVYDATLYGLLGVYANRPKAFGGEERDVIAQLKEVIGHAIAATERKRALMSDEVTEVEFTVPDIPATVGIDMDINGTIMFDRAVPVGDDVFLEYGTVTEDAIDVLKVLVDRLPHFEDVTIVDGGVDTVRFELRLSEPPVVSVVASHGGHVQQARIEDGDLHMTLHLPPSVAARRIIDVIQEAYPTAKLLTRRQITRSDDTPARVHQAVTEDLTERQRAALEAAVYSGFFEWPREASGEDVAESLDIASPTFHQHLRTAQRKVFESLFLTPAPT